MSSKNQRRQAKQQRRAKRVSARRAEENSPGQIGLRLVRDLAPMLVSGDPIDAELAASHLLVPGWEQVLLEDPETANELPHPALPTLALLRELPIDGPSQDADAALALTHALVASDPKVPELVEGGGAIADRLRAAGATDPAWVLEPPAYEPTWAVVMRDAWTYLTRVTIAFRNAAGVEHGIVVEISRLHGYQILEIDVVEDPSALIEHLRREDGPVSTDPMLVVEDIPLVYAAGLVKAALEGTFDHDGHVALLDRDHEGDDDITRLDVLLRRYALLEPIATSDWEAANEHPFRTELDDLTDEGERRARFAAMVPDTAAGAWLVDRIERAHWPVALFGPAEVDSAFATFQADGGEHGTIDELVDAMHAWFDATLALATATLPDIAVEELRARMDAERSGD